MKTIIRLNEKGVEYFKTIEEITDVDYEIDKGETDIETLINIIEDLKIQIDARDEKIEELKDQMNNTSTRSQGDYEETRHFIDVL